MAGIEPKPGDRSSTYDTKPITNYRYALVARLGIHQISTHSLLASLRNFGIAFQAPKTTQFYLASWDAVVAVFISCLARDTFICPEDISRDLF